MADFTISREKIANANRYANRIRNTNKRRYAQAYIAWLLNGEVGIKPEWKCSYMAVQAVRMEIDAMKLWENND